MAKLVMSNGASAAARAAGMIQRFGPDYLCLLFRQDGQRGKGAAKRVNPDMLLTFVGALLTAVSIFGLYRALA